MACVGRNIRAARGHFKFELIFIVISQNFGELINSPDYMEGAYRGYSANSRLFPSLVPETPGDRAAQSVDRRYF
jgi:hypothetical protein